MARTVGNELMNRYVVGFEVAGLLLTVALVGAIALAHREEAEPDASSRGEQPARRASASPRPQAAGPSLISSGASPPR